MPRYSRGPDGLTDIQRDLIRAADLLAPRGTPLSLVAVAARSGHTSRTVNKVVTRLRARGRWPWPPSDIAAERRERLDRVRPRGRKRQRFTRRGVAAFLGRLAEPTP
jgi:hypothetical protein